MFFRNLFFIFLVLGGAATLVANLIPPKHGFKPTPTNPEVFQENDFIETVYRVNASFGQTWQKNKIQPAIDADDLTRVSTLTCWRARSMHLLNRQLLDQCRYCGLQNLDSAKVTVVIRLRCVSQTFDQKSLDRVAALKSAE